MSTPFFIFFQGLEIGAILIACAAMPCTLGHALKGRHLSFLFSKHLPNGAERDILFNK